MAFREKRKEKEREELWKSLEQLEIDHKMKRNFSSSKTTDENVTIASDAAPEVAPSEDDCTA